MVLYIKRNLPIMIIIIIHYTNNIIPAHNLRSITKFNHNIGIGRCLKSICLISIFIQRMICGNRCNICYKYITFVNL